MKFQQWQIICKSVLAFTNLSFMGTQASFILKVLIFSALIAIVIRYVGPLLAIAPTSLNTLIAILTPTLAFSACSFLESEKLSTACLTEFTAMTIFQQIPN